MPGSEQVETLRDIAYTDGGVRGTLDILRPAGGAPVATSAPVLVQVHGGAWSSGAKDEHSLRLVTRMAAAGWVCVAINYRLAPDHRWPAQIIDVKRALAWVRSEIAAYGGDPGRVALTGGSAGGHLAALAALTADDERWQPGFESADTSVLACVPCYGVYDLAGDDGDAYTVMLRDHGLIGNVFPADATLDDLRAASPLHRVRPDAPDFFVLHGDRDSYVPVRQAQVFVAALRETSTAAVEYVEVTGSGHNFDEFDSARARDALDAVQAWLEGRLAHAR